MSLLISESYTDRTVGGIFALSLATLFLPVFVKPNFWTALVFVCGIVGWVTFGAILARMAVV